MALTPELSGNAEFPAWLTREAKAISSSTRRT